MNDSILSKFKISHADFLGAGGSSSVYALGSDKILRVYNDRRNKRIELSKLSNFYNEISGKFSFATPVFIEIGEEGNQTYTIEKRIKGQDLSRVLPNLNREGKTKALRNYFNAMEEIKTATFPDRPYGQILPEIPITGASWPEFLKGVIRERVELNGKYLEEDLERFPEIVEKLLVMADSLEVNPPKCLVHGDYFPNNVMVDEELNVTAVIDMSTHTVIGDPMMDVAGSYIYLEVIESYDPIESEILLPMILEKYEESAEKAIKFYRAYYGIYFAGVKGEPAHIYPNLYSWCVKNLKEFQVR